MPAELRNQVYEYALVPSDGEIVRLHSRTQPLAIGLLRTCKAVTYRAISILYSTSKFRIDMRNLEGLSAAIESVNRKHVSQIRTLVLAKNGRDTLEIGEGGDLPYKAELVAELNLLPRSPFFTLTSVS